VFFFFFYYRLGLQERCLNQFTEEPKGPNFRETEKTEMYSSKYCSAILLNCAQVSETERRKNKGEAKEKTHP